MKKALIFGINGFVGPYLAEELAASGYQIAGSDRAKTCRSSLAAWYREADLLDAHEVEQVIVQAQPNLIVNLAAISSVGQSWFTPQATMQVNAIGALNILEAAKNNALFPRIVFIGSSEEYAPSSEPLKEDSPLCANNPYGVSKMAQERFAEIYQERFDLKVFNIRAFNHTGVGQSDSFVLPSFCKQVAEIERSGKPGVIRVGNLEVARDFSDVRDVVRAYRMIAESDYAGEVFNVGSGIANSLRDLLDYVISLCGQRVKVEIDRSRVRPADVPIIQCNRDKISSLLGWQPMYSIEQTLKALYFSYLD